MVLSSQKLAVIFIKCSGKLFVLAEKRVYVISGLNAESADKHCHGQFSALINMNVHNTVSVDLIFEPSATIRNNRSGICFFAGLINFRGVVHSR